MKYSQFFVSVIIFGLCCNSSAAPLDEVGNNGISDRMQREISQYPDVSQNYAKEVSQSIRNLLVQDANQVLSKVQSTASCRPFIRVTNPGRVTGSGEIGAEKFEKSIFRVESLACLQNISYEKAVPRFLSEEFQLQAVANIKQARVHGDLNCHKTYVFGVGKSDYCFRNHVYEYENLTIIHSEVESNVSGIEVPVYMMDSVNAFYQLPSETAFYSLVFIRGASLNAFIRSIARGIVDSTQQKTIELLDQP